MFDVGTYLPTYIIIFHSNPFLWTDNTIYSTVIIQKYQIYYNNHTILWYDLTSIMKLYIFQSYDQKHDSHISLIHLGDISNWHVFVQYRQDFKKLNCSALTCFHCRSFRHTFLIQQLCSFLWNWIEFGTDISSRLSITFLNKPLFPNNTVSIWDSIYCGNKQYWGHSSCTFYPGHYIRR